MSGSVMASTERLSGAEFEQYVAESRVRLYRFGVVLCGDTVLADELVADVLGRAYERWAQVSAARDRHAYVRRMLVNEFISHKRREARTRPHPEITQLADLRATRLGTTGPDPEDVQADRSALIDELSRLPARQRAAIVLRFYEDLSDDDIAATLGCRVGTVRSSISRGLGTLRVTDTFAQHRPSEKRTS